jgi:Flp pilus assembly protein TadD
MSKLRHSVQLFLNRSLFLLLFCGTLSQGAFSQAHVGDEGTFRGNRAEISVSLRDSSGGTFSGPATVKLFREGIPTGQTSANKGHATFIVDTLGSYTLIVEATGYKTTQKEVSLSMAITDEEVVVLTREPGANETTGVPGKPVLAPKAKEALDKGVQALSDNKLEEAEKDLDEASKLAPNHPDVLYIQGVLYLRRSEWSKAQSTLETGVQIDPNNSHMLGALGMALVDQGKWEEAVGPLERSEQLDAGPWETHWTLARAYYHREKYDGALKEAKEALSGSHGAVPDIELLLAQSQTAVGQFEECAETLRTYLKNHPNEPGAALAKKWLNRLAADGKIKAQQ